MTWTQKVLSAVAHPQIAYLLLMLGTLGLTVELWNPGSILPGVVGGICLLLAFFAFQVLPVSYAGVLLILFGLVLLILGDQGHELRPAGGRRRAQPVLRVDSADGLAVARAPGGAGAHHSGDADALGDHPVPRATRRQSPAHCSRLRARTAMLESVGQALTSIDPGGTGRVRTRGEIWTATAAEPISAGDMVRVIAAGGAAAHSPAAIRAAPAVPLAGRERD